MRWEGSVVKYSHSFLDDVPNSSNQYLEYLPAIFV